MEPKKGTTTIEDLSDQLTVKILSLLPFTTSVLCLRVCKRWLSLISEGPFFLTAGDNIAYLPCYNAYYCLQSGQSGVQKSGVEPNPCQDKYRTLASCNGLLFSAVFSSMLDLYECYVSNPWTREYVTLPKPSKLRLKREYLHETCVCGLAFENKPINSYSYSGDISSSSNKNMNNNNILALFKIVIVQEIKDCIYRFEVYSSKKKRWQLLKPTFKSHILLSEVDNNAVYCNRVLYWQCCDNRALMFNVETETPGHLDLPSDYDEAIAFDKGRSKVAECHGQLHCIVISSTGRRLSIWKMSPTTTSDGWMRLHNVDLVGAVKRNLDIMVRNGRSEGAVFRPIDLNCQRDDKVLLHYNYYGIVSYDIKRDVFELLKAKQVHPFSFFRYNPTNKSLSKSMRRSEDGTARPSRKRRKM